MKNRFSNEQIINIHREAEAGVSARNSAAITLFQTLPSTPSARGLVIWKYLRRSGLTCL